MTFTKGGVIHRDIHKGGNGGKIQAMGTFNYFIVCQVMLLGVSDHLVKKLNVCPIPINIYLKVL